MNKPLFDQAEAESLSGFQVVQRLSDQLQGLMRLVEHVIIRKPNDSDAKTVQEQCSLPIIFPVSGTLMFRTIDFDPEFQPGAVEIEYIFPNANLSSEFVSQELPLSEISPEHALRSWRISPQRLAQLTPASLHHNSSTPPYVRRGV